MYNNLRALLALLLLLCSLGAQAEGLRLGNRASPTISLATQIEEAHELQIPTQQSWTTTVGFKLSFEKSDKHKDCGLRLYGHARHLATKVKYNEANWGWALECYRSIYGQGLYYHTGHLINSYGCMTGVAGVGYKEPLIDLGNFGLGVGVEADLLKYCIPGHVNGKGVYVAGKMLEGGPLIFPLLYMSYNDKGSWHMQLNLHRLDHNVYLWSTSLRIRF